MDCMAVGENPKGRLSCLLKILVVIFGLLMLLRTLGMIINLWKEV